MRGLKQFKPHLRSALVWSHPSWVRGLKQHKHKITHTFIASHPSWVRGLKLLLSTTSHACDEVAPLVGAWIETCLITSLNYAQSLVAPLVGAWIETTQTIPEQHHQPWSHPSWVRGLKHKECYDESCTPLSHPSWVRGLKL